jgi:hypothetical protein
VLAQSNTNTRQIQVLAKLGQNTSLLLDHELCLSLTPRLRLNAAARRAPPPYLYMQTLYS